jgi:hypothetical protein
MKRQNLDMQTATQFEIDQFLSGYQAARAGDYKDVTNDAAWLDGFNFYVAEQRDRLADAEAEHDYRQQFAS